MAEHNQRFDTFGQWVNMASSWLTRRGSGVHAICYDTKGRECLIGGDFMRARDEDAFPVQWIWPEQVAKLMKEMVCRTPPAPIVAEIIAQDYIRMDRNDP